MSHELRTPLNSIIGFSQVLEGQISEHLTEKQLGYLNNVKESGNHLLEMVNDILDLSKIEAGRIEIDTQPFDFGGFLERSIQIIQATADKKSLRVAVNIQPGLGRLNGDQTRLKQIIYNLLSNAVKFTDPGKRIGLDAKAVEDHFEVIIWDEGWGIPETHLDKIFDPFEQIKGSRQAKEGTGLGLAISKRLIKLHQGTLTVSSKLGEGSRFTISLPGRMPGEKPFTKSSEIKQNGNSASVIKTAKILVTEDNKANRELIKAALDNDQLDFAISGEEAVKIASEKEYDLILMDIQLPEMNGTDAMKQIRQNSRKHIPIFALTAFAMKGDEKKYLDEGFDDYISKPIDIMLLQKKIEDALK